MAGLNYVLSLSICWNTSLVYCYKNSTWMFSKPWLLFGWAGQFSTNFIIFPDFSCISRSMLRIYETKRSPSYPNTLLVCIFAEQHFHFFLLSSGDFVIYQSRGVLLFLVVCISFENNSIFTKLPFSKFAHFHNKRFIRH